MLRLYVVRTIGEGTHCAIGENSLDAYDIDCATSRTTSVNSSTSEIGVELFQFKDQANPKDNFEYWKTGVFHFCVQDPNVEELAERIVAAGGKRRMKKPRYYYPRRSPIA